MNMLELNEKDEILINGKLVYVLIRNKDQYIISQIDGPYPRIISEIEKEFDGFAGTHDALLEFTERYLEPRGTKINCIIPFDCHCGCQFITCPHFVSTMGG